MHPPDVSRAATPRRMSTSRARNPRTRTTRSMATLATARMGSCALRESGTPRADVPGRLYEVVDPRVPAPIELGGEFVHGRPAITYGLLREFGATVVDGAPTGFVFQEGAVASNRRLRAAHRSSRAFARSGARRLAAANGRATGHARRARRAHHLSRERSRSGSSRSARRRVRAARRPGAEPTATCSSAARARAALAAPIDGMLWFAGEATAAGGEGGTVAGALQSGMRAAREILAAR